MKTHRTIPTTAIVALTALATNALVTGAFGQEMRFRPVRTAPGGSAVATWGTAIDAPFNATLNCFEYTIDAGGEQVQFLIQAGGWINNAMGDPTLGAAQARIDSTGYSNGLGGDLVPFNFAGNRPDGAYQVPNYCTPDFGGDGRPCSAPFDAGCAVGGGICIPFPGWLVPPANSPINAVATSTIDYAWAAAAGAGSMVDDGTFKDFGTLVLEVPTNAVGTYQLNFNPDPVQTLLTDGSGAPVQGVVLVGACVTIVTGKCCSNKGPNVICQDDLTEFECAAALQPSAFTANAVCTGVIADDCPTSCDFANLTAIYWADDLLLAADPFDRPGNCAIDAREPHNISDPLATNGWDRLILQFDCDPALIGMVAGDFTVSVTPAGVAPAISSIAVDSVANTATVGLNEKIKPSTWTCITHTESGNQWCAGYLPADANQDLVSDGIDINRLIDSINNVPGRVLPLYASDINRDSIASGPDILRLIDLLNGNVAFQAWTNEMLPPRPCPDPDPLACCSVDGSCQNLAPGECWQQPVPSVPRDGSCSGDISQGIDATCIPILPGNPDDWPPGWVGQAPPGKDIIPTSATIGIDLPPFDENCQLNILLDMDGPVVIERSAGDPVTNSMTTEIVGMILTGGGVTLRAGAAAGGIGAQCSPRWVRSSSKSPIRLSLIAPSTSSSRWTSAPGYSLTIS